jgi:hypothetical protein
MMVVVSSVLDPNPNQVQAPFHRNYWACNALLKWRDRPKSAIRIRSMASHQASRIPPSYQAPQITCDLLRPQAIIGTAAIVSTTRTSLQTID